MDTDKHYTAEDYLNGEEPYKEIYALRENNFQMLRALETATKAAANVGVKNFKTLYKAYCDSQKRDALVTCDNATNADGQMLQLSCGDWTCDDCGVRRGGGSFEEVACQIPVLITRRYENIDTGSEKIELSFKKGGIWRRIIISCSQYASPKELVKLSDCGLPINLRMAQSLSDYLMDLYALNYDTMPASRSVSRLGWIGDNGTDTPIIFSPYVADVVFDGALDYKPIFSAIKPSGTLEGWVDAAVKFRAESLAARIVLAASFASVLVKPLGLLPFFVHLWGVDSSTGKTVALMAAASVWASPEMGKYVKTFDGTDVGYERTASFLNSLPLCIDELQLAKNARGIVVFNVYRLSQGAGRMRGNRTGGIEETPTWSNAILTSGETPINTAGVGAGAVNRVIEIECTSSSKVVSDGHKIPQ